MKNEKIKQMVTLSLLVALTVVLQLLGYVLPRIGPFGLSFVLIPIVIGAAVYGPKGGAILGGAFGAIVCFCSYNGMDGGGFMVWQANPLLCILVVMAKGILAGTFSGLVYKLLAAKNKHIELDSLMPKRKDEILCILIQNQTATQQQVLISPQATML